MNCDPVTTVVTTRFWNQVSIYPKDFHVHQQSESCPRVHLPTQILPLCSLLHFYRKSVNFTIHSSFMQPCEPGPGDVVPQRASGSIPCCGTMTHMKHRFKMSMQAFQITTRIRVVSCGRNHDVLCSSLRTNLAQRQKEIKTDFQRGSPRSKGKLHGEQKQPFT